MPRRRHEGEVQRTFRLHKEDLDWLKKVADRIGKRPDQIGRVGVNNVLQDIIKKAREANYGEVQATADRS